MNDQVSISGWQAKVISVWAMIGVTSWTEAAAFIGFCYTACLMSEWLWKNIGRPVLESRGIIKVKPKAVEDAAD